MVNTIFINTNKNPKNLAYGRQKAKYATANGLA